MLNQHLTYITLAEANPVLPLALSLLGTIGLFILVRLAMFFYRSADRNLLIFARRIADLDARILRLDIVIENLEKQEKKLSNIRIVTYKGHTPNVLAKLEVAPIQRAGNPSFVEKGSDGYSLCAQNSTKNEAVVEFSLSEPCQEAYIVAENQKGKTVKAYLNLSTSETQMLSFHKA